MVIDDIRVVLVGEEVVSAAAIRTPNPHPDFRQDPCNSTGQAHYDPVVLPPDVMDLCRKAARACGLCYAGLDIKHRRGGVGVPGTEQQPGLPRCGALAGRSNQRGPGGTAAALNAFVKPGPGRASPP
ncbi:MAG: hypothetical protein ACH34U_01920 [Cyanobium sp.]